MWLRDKMSVRHRLLVNQDQLEGSKWGKYDLFSIWFCSPDEQMALAIQKSLQNQSPQDGNIAGVSDEDALLNQAIMASMN